MATQTQSNPSAQSPSQPPKQGHAARNAALAAVAASTLPGPPLAAAALTVTQIAQATTALLTALKRFQMTRAQEFDAELRKEAVAEEPTLGDVIDGIISRELGFEATFRAKQYARVQAALGPALAVSDAKERVRAVKALFEKERRFTKMREEAMRVRTMAAVRHYHLEQASPQGAYWMLGEGVKQHTLDCLAMAHTFHPWSVLHAFAPPVHHGCACSLIGLHEAVAKGLMTPDQVPDEMAAVAHATDVLQRAADAMRDGRVSEAEIAAYITGLRLEEAAWTERFPKGTAFAGRFRPRVGGDPGAALLKRLGLGQRGKVLHDLMPSVKPLAASERGRWTWVKGRYTHIPLATDWRQQRGGEVFHSPAGTTNVYRDGKLLATSELPGEKRSEILTRLSDMAGRARARFADRTGMPLRRGDGPDAVLSMEQRGWHPHRMQPAGAGAWKISYHHIGSGAIANATVTKAGAVTDADWDPSPIPPTRARVSRVAPRSFGEHVQDGLAWAHELGERYGAPVRVTQLGVSSSLEDHAGLHEHSGETWLGHEVRSDIERAGRARAAGRGLSDDEKRGVYSSFWATAHEIAHGVNPIHPELYHGEDRNLEEALTEESSHRMARERLASQGQGDVVAWAAAHPRATRGVYRRQRGALADVLDQAGVVDPTERAAAVEGLKFQVDPGQRFRVLGLMIHQQHPEVSVEEGEARARALLRKGATARGAVPQSPGLMSLWKGHHPKKGEPKSRSMPKPEPLPKPPPVILGGDVPEPAEQGPIPSFSHVPLELGGQAFRFGRHAQKARAGGRDWVVKAHHGDKLHVASELLANAVYRDLGVAVPEMGHVRTPGEPDFSQVPDALVDEPPLPTGTRISTGVILRSPAGKVTLIEPRNHFGGYEHTFPKGGLEEGLTAQQNALKELWEETGLHGHITGVVGDFKGDTGVTRYYVGVLTGGEATPSEETQAIKTVTMKQAAELLNKDRDKEVLAAVAKTGVPKGKFEDDFPPVVPGSALAFEAPVGKSLDAKGPSAPLGEGYMADALLGNWDFVGKWGDNLRWQGEDTPVRVNHDSALEYKPGGGRKPFGDLPQEVWSMLHRGQGTKVIVTEDGLREQARAIAQTLTPARVADLVDAAPFPSSAARDRIEAALNARVEWMRQFGDGEIDLPEPAEGAEARGLHADQQKKFQLYPEEQQALDSYVGADGRELDRAARSGQKPSEKGREIAKRLDGLLKDAKTSADSYAYIGHHEDIGSSLVGQTVKQRSFTLAHTDRQAADGQTRIRVTLPGGAHAWHLTDAGEGQPDLLLPRGARMQITGIATDADGVKTAHALLLPYEPPSALPGSYSPMKSYTEKSVKKPKFGEGDKVTLNGMDGTVREYVGNGMMRVRMDDGGKTYVVPHGSLTLREAAGFELEMGRMVLSEADEHNDGVMVALHPHPATAKKFALPGGEPAGELHVTLGYLGKQQELKDPEGLKRTVRDWAARTAPLEGEISGHGVFTAGPKPVTYLSPDLPGLPAARQSLVDDLDSAGQPLRKDHGFTPHITLDYADRSSDLPDHGGHRVRFPRASLVIGDEKHTFPFGGTGD